MGGKSYAVYILASKKNGILYIGVTNNLVKRVLEHKTGIIKGFPHKYNIHKLVYYEITPYITDAIHREKRLKRWDRKWKIDLINESNPDWNDLYDKILE